MEEYVKIDDVVQDIKDLRFTMSMCSSVEQCEGMKRAQRIISEFVRIAIKPADVRQALYGTWMPGNGENSRMCSNCKVTQTITTYKDKVMFRYCPYCGADMREGNNE